MHFHPKKHNFLLISFLAFEFFVANSLPALALFGGGPSIPSASSVMSDMEKRYHLNTGSLQNQGEMMNVAQNKSTVPDVSLFFSPSDPKEGERETVKAFPSFFSNNEQDLYYTWFLKRNGCDISGSTSDKNRFCDANDDGEITVEDWKITATRILIHDGYDSADNVTIDSDIDNDGYNAQHGGDNKTTLNNQYCYINDPSTGTNYEFARNFAAESFGCPAGTSPVCMESLVNVTPQELSAESSADSGATSSSVAGTLFEYTDTGSCTVSGVPSCSPPTPEGIQTPICSTGEPRCVANPAETNSCGSPLSQCSITPASNVHRYCQHLFANSPDNESGNGSFPIREERFWGTNPHDPSTADNGNKDEANAVGLGLSSFTWTYQRGDKVGVAVEGTSLMSTKHDNSSFMIMWAFSNKKCDPQGKKGSYLESIKGYPVTIPAIEMDLNDCIPGSLVDPTVGGQATKLTLSMSASPDTPLNNSTDKSGDVVSVRASVDNGAKNITNTLFNWKVSIGKKIGDFDNDGGALDITSHMREEGLLGNTRGNALDSVDLKMNINTLNNHQDIKQYLGNDSIGYLRFQVTAVESFGEDYRRKGNSDIIVKFINSDQRISVLGVKADDDGRVSLNNTSICDEGFDRTLCRVIKNEIIGLRVDDSNLSNFHWTINETPLLCTEVVSGSCKAEVQNEINFFPVTGNPGDTYTVTVTADRLTDGEGSGIDALSLSDETITLTRTFAVVEPSVTLRSTDESSSWRKFLGQYKDIEGLTNDNRATCPGGLCDDLSEFLYQTYSGNEISFYADFVPNSLGNTASLAFTVDGESTSAIPWSASSLTPPEQEQQITPFFVTKLPGEVYDIQVSAQIAQNDALRKALMTIWGISPFASPEIRFSSSVQVEVEAPLTEASLHGPRKYYATVASYIPASVLFTFRIVLSAFLILFVLHFVNRILEGHKVSSFAREVASSKKE